MNILAFLLLLTAGQPAGVPPDPALPPAQQQRSGLWIAGIAFAPDDIASATQEFEGESALPNVVITFTESGRVKFQYAQQGRLNDQLEIRVDGEIVASPYLMEMITGNQISISGGFTREEAAALARRIAPPR